MYCSLTLTCTGGEFPCTGPPVNVPIQRKAHCVNVNEKHVWTENLTFPRPPWGLNPVCLAPESSVLTSELTRFSTRPRSILTLGNVLFLILKFINYLLLESIRSPRHFADDCVLCRNIKSPMDCQILQDDLNSLVQ